MRKPVSGGIWGIILGIAVALVLQQQGIWPLDKLGLFLLPGLIGLIGVLITSLGRAGATAPLAIMLVITLGLAAYGATGFGDMNEVGELNGGCTVQATSAVDSTIVTDTSRMDPFDIDPRGSLSWMAKSGSVFDDYPWRIYVEIGGSEITIDEEASEDNDAGDTENSDTVANVEEYGESRGIPVSQLRGIYKVGGFASVCNGFGFVNILSEPLESLLSKVAAAIALLALIMLIRAFVGSRPPADPPSANGGGEPPGDGPNDEGADRSIATDIAGGALTAGYISPDLSDADLEEDPESDQIIEAFLEERSQELPPLPPDGNPEATPDTVGEVEPEKENPNEGLPGLED